MTLQPLLDHLQTLRPKGACWILGITGAVASGKSTLATALAARIASWPGVGSVGQAGTDGFLFPNAELERRGILGQKGFPESYDRAGLESALAAVRTGAAFFPGYSHVTYDIDPQLGHNFTHPDVLILDGLGFGDPVNRLAVDCLIYLDAPDDDLQSWYVERFIDFWRAAETDPESFYARFRQMDEAAVRDLARSVWQGVNLPNLHKHILPLRSVADIVVVKTVDHQIVRLEFG